MDSMKWQYAFTEVTARKPEHLSKKFDLVDGVLQCRGGGRLFEGHAAVRTVEHPEEFLAALRTAGSKKCFMYGVPTLFGQTGQTHYEIWQTKDIERREKQGKLLLTEKPPHLPVISRTRMNFAWPQAPYGGIFFADYDPLPGKPVLSADQVLSALFAAAPGLAETPYVVKPSNSAYLYNSGSEEELKGPRGLHCYFLVTEPWKNAEIGDTLFNRLWLNGDCQFILSGSGGFLPRGPVDRAVFGQPERLDFCGEPFCSPPIVRRAPPAQIINGSRPPVALSRVVEPLTPQEEKRLKDMQQEEKRRRRPESEARRKEWIAERLQELGGSALAPVSSEQETQPKLTIKTPPEKTETQKTRELTLEAAATKRILYADFPIVMSTGETVTVQEILANPGRYNKKTCRDPLEPNYRDGAVTGWINLSGVPYIRSHAHGGARFDLSRDRCPEEVVPHQVNRAELSSPADDRAKLSRPRADPDFSRI